MGQCGWECVHKGRHGHKGREKAAPALAGSVEARDCGGDVRTWGIGFDGGASVRLEREPGLQLASSVLRGKRAISGFIAEAKAVAGDDRAGAGGRASGAIDPG